MDITKEKTSQEIRHKSQFPNCSLVWMFHSRNITNRINRLSESSLASLVYNDSKNVSFRDLLLKNKSVHNKKLQLLAMEYLMFHLTKPKVDICLIFYIK